MIDNGEGNLMFPVSVRTCLGGIAILCLLAGCSGQASGPPRRGVAGTVSYDNKMLDYGEIRFLPEPDGPVSIAIINEGKYQLPTENGVSLGAVRVQISALTKSTGPMLDETGNPPAAVKGLEIPKKYNSASELKADIPSGDGVYTLDFNLVK